MVAGLEYEAVLFVLDNAGERARPRNDGWNAEGQALHAHIAETLGRYGRHDEDVDRWDRTNSD